MRIARLIKTEQDEITSIIKTSKMEKSNYTKFILMLVCSAISMYIATYFNTYEFSHVYFS